MHPNIFKMIDDRSLVSAMNRTKWGRLAQAITAESELQPTVRLKSLDEAQASGFSLMDWKFSEFNPALKTLGMGSYLNILYVVHAEVSVNCIRIISARKADKKETKYYFRGLDYE